MSTSPGPVSGAGAFQNSLYVGTNVQNILYGAELVLYFKTMHIILFKKRTRGKSDIFYALFSSMMVFSITLWVASQAWIGQEMWLLYPNYPGGPDAYWQKHISDWYMDWGTTAVILLQLMTDALMIYRCRIVWNSYWVIIFPTIVWMATLVLGILVDWVTSSPGGNFFSSSIASQLGIAYYTLAVFLNAILTTMICYRITRHGQRIREHVGREEASLYFSVTSMVIESVLPYTISGIAFLVSYGMGNPTSVAFMSVYITMMMLILRVIVGRAWDSETSKTGPSAVRFDFGSTLELDWSQGSGGRADLESSHVPAR